ncbi:MAG: transcriptional regulator [Robiginitomaculum sp.]|nr:MAG: transcriptional regulator [Robiginitomaculum sp.]
MSASIKNINDIIHGRLRLGVMAYLSTASPVSFPELLKVTEATNGNLSTHLTKLETAGFIHQEKGYKGKRPQTLVHLTDEGRSAWIEYLKAMRLMLDI